MTSLASQSESPDLAYRRRLDEALRPSTVEGARPTRAQRPAHQKRAAVALVFRVQWSDGCPRRVDLEALRQQRWEAEVGQKAILELLFMQRTTRETDRWSGHVAFPGGKQDPEDEDDQATAVREAKEELNLDLDESGRFHFLGYLPDRPITGKGRRIADFYLVPTLWLQLEGESQPLTRQDSEVAAWRWVKVGALRPNLVTYDLISQDSFMSRQFAPWLPNFLHRQFEATQFPAIALDTRVMSNNYDATDSSEAKFILWGLTLAATTDALVLGSGPERHLAWPPIRLRTAWANGVVKALCGAASLRYPGHYPRRGDHIFALAAALALPVAVGAGALAAYLRSSRSKL